MVSQWLVCFDWQQPGKDRKALKQLSPSTLVGLMDVAPLLGLVPLFAGYCLTLVLMLQRIGALHGVKAGKVVCAIFTHSSS